MKQSIDNSLIPLDKLSDFGAHANAYYQVALKYFLSAADKKVIRDIISHSWGEAIESSPLIANAPFLSRLMDQATKRLNNVQSGSSTACELSAPGVVAKEDWTG